MYEQQTDHRAHRRSVRKPRSRRRDEGQSDDEHVTGQEHPQACAAGSSGAVDDGRGGQSQQAGQIRNRQHQAQAQPQGAQVTSQIDYQGAGREGVPRGPQPAIDVPPGQRPPPLVR